MEYFWKEEKVTYKHNENGKNTYEIVEHISAQIIQKVTELTTTG